jgi:thiol-disulfide isomerase/thioredoxin
MVFAVTGSFAQSKVPTSAPGKTIFRDSNGELISNNEFVDIRMANFNYPDATIVKSFDDGTVEFRLQKIPQEGVLVRDFRVRTIDGKEIAMADLKGKVVVLNFWFIGCAVCRAMKPLLDDFKAKFSDNDNVVFLAMTADPAGAVKDYLQKEPFHYIQAADAKTALDSFAFAGYPKNIVISKTGEIIYWRSVIRAWPKFESVVRAELAK